MYISNRSIGYDDPTFIVAEIGANHNGDFELAKRSIRAAAEAGVDAVKFQTYTADELLSDHERIVSWGKSPALKSEKIGDMFNRLSLKRQWHLDLFNYAKSLGVIPFSTPFSLDGVRFLNELKVPCFKVAASDVNYLEMLTLLAKMNKPVMLSLGKCSLSEADIAINTLLNNGCKDLVIMHCVSQYPSPMEEMNLRVIKSTKAMYPECIVGFSDHSLGITSAIGAVVLGARVIEKHFTLNKQLDGPDHWFSLDPLEMKLLVNEIRNIELALGSPRKRVMPSEENERQTSIRSIVLNKDLNYGDIIRKEDIKFTRPGWGISPFDRDKIIGLKINKSLPKNTVLKWEYFK
ncbi:N-acetylneuraminate synthase family protein [Cytobacillus solani]|uniref:AFP-like domain-containing protein n=1 Tax=Cytobacillus solani TaxID=1637975 RepID=A0A0Q3T719_9BACI|nr:N-acetylneuraminate synthase family protein [Cytobacillus solani]KOP82299.1 hypothetical protein AMS60_07235 [Bacillus sp. FJAT-21945]KQL19309.1 hypothetical protein AN957_12505 [Cytobacillus solani]